MLDNPSVQTFGSFGRLMVTPSYPLIHRYGRESIEPTSVYQVDGEDP